MIKKTPKNNGIQEFIKQEPNQAPLLSNLLITTTTTKVQVAEVSENTDGNKEEVKVEKKEIVDPIQKYQIPEIDEDQDDNDEIEHQTDSLMKLMQDIKNLREVNKTLTDEERRKNAEEMVLKLS